MPKIIPNGEYFSLNEKGHIVNPCSKQHLTGVWSNAVNDLISAYKDIHKEDLHSIYLRGSVPRGTMIVNISDIDSFCLVHKLADEERLERVQSAIRDKVIEYYPDVNGVEFDSSLREDALNSHHKRFLIKTQSLCVWGKDEGKNIEPMEISIQSMNTCLYLREINDMYLEDVDSSESLEDAQNLCSWVFKASLRAAFEIVMLRERKFTRDLFLCWKSYSKYYPVNSEMMMQALSDSINPISDLSQITSKWLAIYDVLQSRINASEHLLK